MNTLLVTSVFLTSAGVRRHFQREENDSAHERKSGHQSVMLREVVELLAPKKGDIVVDATYGRGGHSAAFKKAARIHLIALDADPEAGVIEGNFADLKKILKKEKIVHIDKALFDLGWRAEQLIGRGFSFLHDEPLSMSYGKNPRSGFSAKDILNTWSEKVIADILFGYGEERYARRIAKKIVERRALKLIETTFELVEIIKDAMPASQCHGRLNPATRSFQALRIAVNDELTSLTQGLTAAWEALAMGGRIAVITFHSIEDRVVKRLFRNFAKAGGILLTKKPLTPSRAEIQDNPRARSAKLRVIEKIQTKNHD